MFTTLLLAIAQSGKTASAKKVRAKNFTGEK